MACLVSQEDGGGSESDPRVMWGADAPRCSGRTWKVGAGSSAWWTTAQWSGIRRRRRGVANDTFRQA